MEFHFLPTIPLIILITISYYQSQNMVFAQQEQYDICSKPFQCANISEIDYPFWGSSRPSYCGHPDFQLSCNSQIASITFSGLTYEVLKIDNSSQVLTVARTDYISDICPAHLQNATIDTNFFSTLDIKNVTIYYGCMSTISVNASFPWISSQFTCNINKADMSCYFLTSVLSSVTSGFFGTCKENVVVQANETVANSFLNMPNPSQTDLTIVLDQGFGLKWDANNTDETCRTCKVSGGACGYDSSSSSFVCFCSDQAYMSRCNGTVHPPVHSAEGKDKDSNNLPLAIGLSIAGAAVVGLILGGWFMHRRKRKAIAQTPSKEFLSPSPFNKIVHTPTNLSMSIPPYPYSNSKSDMEKGSTYFGVQVFSFTELEEATDNFDPAKELGSGGFGTVYYGVLRDGRSVAVKRLFDNNVKRAEQFMNEVEILHGLRHPNLVTLHGCTSRRSKELILVYEYIPNGTVADHIHRGKSNSAVLTWPVRLSIAVETADALTYLHTSDVIHRDVKTNNILLDNKFHVKVADFGLSRLFPNNCTHVSTAPQGTPGYVDPEYYHTYQLTDKSDVYSFGVVLIELISSLEAVDTNRDRHHINLASMAITKIQNQSIDELIDPSLGFEKDPMVRKMAKLVAEVAFRCLQQERDMRPTMGEVLQILRKIQSENSAVKAKELDGGQDDIGLLKHVHPPLSPDSVVNGKWISSSTLSSY